MYDKRDKERDEEDVYERTDTRKVMIRKCTREDIQGKDDKEMYKRRDTHFKKSTTERVYP